MQIEEAIDPQTMPFTLFMSSGIFILGPLRAKGIDTHSQNYFGRDAWFYRAARQPWPPGYKTIVRPSTGLAFYFGTGIDGIGRNPTVQPLTGLPCPLITCSKTNLRRSLMASITITLSEARQRLRNAGFDERQIESVTQVIREADAKSNVDATFAMIRRIKLDLTLMKLMILATIFLNAAILWKSFS